MSTLKNACKAKNPATCPYHGVPVDADSSLRGKIAGLFTGQRVSFPSFSEKAEKVSASVVISPLGSNVKMEPIYVDVEGSSLEDAASVIGAAVDGLRLKEFKSGYQADIILPGSDSEGAVPIRFYASSLRSALDDDSVTEDGVAGFKQAVKAQVARQVESNRRFEVLLNDTKDIGMAHSVSGAKALAVVEAMNEFKYFHLDDTRSGYDVTSAFRSILDKTSEYTNRGYGVRVHMSYLANGELRDARFSLDQPEGRFSVLKQADVDRINVKLKKYFASLAK